MGYKSFLARVFCAVFILSPGALSSWVIGQNVQRAQGAKGSAGQHDRGPGKTAGETRINPRDGLTYVWIPPGTFRMGCSPDDHHCRDRDPRFVTGPWEEPHTVTLTKGFWMGQTLVTQETYLRVLGRQAREVRDSYPGKGMPKEIENWKDANAYCVAVGMRLPTEAEWEYAARAGTTTARYGDADAIAWYSGNSGGRPHPVQQKQPNAWKLYDMLGNLREWTNDWFSDDYFLKSPAQDPQGPAAGHQKVMRGTSYLWGVNSVRVSERVISADNTIGFRCAGELP